MSHPIYKVTGFEIAGPHVLRVSFDDGTVQTINFQPVLAGELYAPLNDIEFFDKVSLDSEVHTLVWPNGADFDPATLHDWPVHEKDLRERAKRWQMVQA
jgi:hypothetical protein